MIDLAQEFVYVRSEVELPDDTQLVSRPTDLLLPHGRFRVAVDHRGRKHALFPVSDRDPDLTEATASVRLTTRPLVVDGAAVKFVDLECTDSQLELVFEHLVADVVERVEVDPSAPARSCLEALREWRELLRADRGGLPRDVALGLVGELELLRLLGSRSPGRALDSWTGPARTTHDFVRGGRHLEVKSTGSVDGQTIRISNIDQLDPDTAPGGLHLAVVHCTADESAPSLDDRIRSLVAAGFPKTRLVKAVGAAGHVFEAGQPAPRFAVRSVRLWPVDHTFPGLRSGDIPASRRAAISQIRYELSLAGAPEPLTGDAMKEVLSTWCDA